MGNQINAYKENSVTTQSKGRLVVMLYDGAIKFLRQAVAALEAGDMAAKGRYIGRAMDIINELDAVLDVDTGGEIAHNLRGLYDFVRRHVQRGHLANDPQPLTDAAALLTELNEGWKAISA
jgi:flagellar protein FliS